MNQLWVRWHVKEDKMNLLDNTARIFRKATIGLKRLSDLNYVRVQIAGKVKEHNNVFGRIKM